MIPSRFKGGLARHAWIPLDPDALPALEHVLQSMANHMARECDRAWFTGVTGDEINAWMLLAADAFALGSAATGDQRWLLDYAVPSFNTGAGDPFYPGDLSHYHSSKELVNLVAAGTIFLHFAPEGGVEPTPTPPTAATPTPPPVATPTPGGPTDTPTPISPIGPGTLIFQQNISPDAGYAGCSDTVVSNLWQENSQLGGWDLLGLYYGEQEHHRILVRFDLSSVPPGTPIESAVLSLYHVRNTDAGDDRPQEVNVYRVTSPWTEGTGDNPYPEPGYAPDGATWTLAGPGIPWKTAGGDFDPARQASATAPPFSNPDWVSWDVTGLVGEWMNGGAPNHGLMLRAGGGEWLEHRFASRNAAVPGQRPRLIIRYGAIPTPTPIATNITVWEIF